MGKKLFLILLIGIIVHAGYQFFKSFEISERFSDDLDTLMLGVSTQTEESFKQQVIMQAEREEIRLVPEEVSVLIEDTNESSLGSRVMSGTGAAVQNKKITVDIRYQILIDGFPLDRAVHRTKVFAARIGSPASVQDEQLRQAE